jgi:hypothetical protein
VVNNKNLWREGKGECAGRSMASGRAANQREL